MASTPSSRLNGIFQDATASSGGNDALRYTAPREPSIKQPLASQTAVQQPPPSQTAAPPSVPASTVVFSTMVSLYQYDATVRKYVQLGGSTPGTNAAVGCVIVGAQTTYTLLFYTAAKHHLCAVPLKFGSFKPTLQAKSFVNFYDDQGVNWSVKFASDLQVAEWMRQVFLTKMHVEIWGPDKTVTKTTPGALIHDDLLYVPGDTLSVHIGDTVAVAFGAWRVVGTATSAPGEVVTKYAPFEHASQGELRKLRLGDARERIQALEEAIVGMKKGGKRIVLVPPGKTNGQDWYLLDIELVKTKTGLSKPRTDAMGPATGFDDALLAAAKTVRRRPSSRRTGPLAVPSVRRPTDRVADAKNRDLVPYEDNADEMDDKDVRLMSRAHQLERQARALEREGLRGLDAMDVSAARRSGHYAIDAASTRSQALPMRPVDDDMLSEVKANVDYLIRLVAPSTSRGGTHVGASPSDVAAVLRGVECLASENERLVVQLDAQHHAQALAEKRYQDLVDRNQRLQHEHRTLEERYQAATSTQLTATSDWRALASAHDAAVTESNRWHAEYQHLLTAYDALQHEVGTRTETEAHEHALVKERDARARAEKQLETERQARGLAEQELALAKKQHDVALQVKVAEVAAATEHQVRKLQTHVRHATDECLRLQAHADAQSTLVAETQQRVAQLQHDKDALKDQLDASLGRIHELETQTHRLEKQLAVGQQTVCQLEQDKIDPVPPASTGSDRTCSTCAASKARELAAERALTAAEAIKREAQELLTVAAHSGSAERARLVALVKASVNDLFFRFQDLFEQETAVDGQQVLHAIRKVLKSSIKSMVQQLQQVPAQSQAEGDDGDRLVAPPVPTLVEPVRPIEEHTAADTITGDEGATQDSVVEALGERDSRADATQRVATSNDSDHTA